MRYAVVIPARYQSSRFPGKPLVDLNGTPMIQRVWERCCIAVGKERVYIATENKLIYDFCKGFTDNVLMTSDNCKTGTDRVYEACQQIDDIDFVVNVQGDEPLISPKEIATIVDEYIENPGKIINGMARITSDEEYRSLTIPKVVFRSDGRLLYMSRAAIPGNKTGDFVRGWKQICIYAFPVDVLTAFVSVKDKSLFENEEDIEILRFLELGYDVKMKEVLGKSVAVDTEADADKVRALLEFNPQFNLE
ncbi:3-deoxy-manno-octulosonate cytidylyltransferase [Shewanella colwelliana]|uniref:3-deoxy-manno-octulosonate cytidylyltransferase n=1 Tax=Shewanella colwelliana TaxID=23 RepID=UPI00048BA81E|nr:3-deoxy-manno-octulosonate cytidylyltransferase [Shewanella colwelliana]